MVLAPLGSIQLFDPDGAAAVARATTEFGTMMILSSVALPEYEEVAGIGTSPKVYQLYLYGGWDWMDAIIGRSQEVGYPRDLPDGGHAGLQPPRARHREALGAPVGAAGDDRERLHPPGADVVGDGGAREGDVLAATRGEGHQHRRRRAAGSRCGR